MQYEFMYRRLSVERMSTRTESLLAFETPQRDAGRQLNICCSEACLPASKHPFALNRHRGRFNICWAKSCTPVFLFLLSSEPEPLMFFFPPRFFPPPFLVLPFSFYHTAQKASVCLAQCLPRPPVTHLSIYSGANQSSCFEADPEGCGFYPWLVIVAVSSVPKWVDASHTQTLHYFVLIYITVL